MHNNLLKEVYR